MTSNRKTQAIAVVLSAALAGGAVIYRMCSRHSSHADARSSGETVDASEEGTSASSPTPDLGRNIARLRSLADGASSTGQNASPDSAPKMHDARTSFPQHFKRIPSRGDTSGTEFKASDYNAEKSRRERLMQNIERMHQNGTIDDIMEILEHRKAERSSDPSTPSTDNANTAL